MDLSDRALTENARPKLCANYLLDRRRAEICRYYYRPSNSKHLVALNQLSEFKHTCHSSSVHHRIVNAQHRHRFESLNWRRICNVFVCQNYLIFERTVQINRSYSFAAVSGINGFL